MLRYVLRIMAGVTAIVLGAFLGLLSLVGFLVDKSGEERAIVIVVAVVAVLLVVLGARLYKPQRNATRSAAHSLPERSSQLDDLDRMGVESLGVAVEWSTAGDDRVCPLCQPLEGIVLTSQEARGMNPRHESCRCVWIPANVGEDRKKQKRSQRSIQQAIDKSILAEIPESSKRTLSDQKKLSSWAGAMRIISKKRPKSIFD